MSELGQDQICRHENCDIEEVHAKHHVMRALPEPKPARPGKKPPWRQDDPEALTESVYKATSDAYPMLSSWIARDVRDDYGTCTDRTVYRHLRRLVAEARLVKVDLGLAFSAYIRPKSRLLADPQALRDYMLAQMEITACTKDSTGVREASHTHSRPHARDAEQKPKVWRDRVPQKKRSVSISEYILEV
jgi:hypothetical protein